MSRATARKAGIFVPLEKIKRSARKFQRLAVYSYQLRNFRQLSLLTV